MSALTSHWTLDPSLIYVSVAAVLYWVGGRTRAHGGESFRSLAAQFARPRELVLRELAFTLGLLSIVIALCSPIDYYVEQLFWVHMGQHIILLTIAPPLILLGRPWPRMWRAIPIRTRTHVGRTLAQSPWTKPLRWIARPVPAFVLFNANMLLWHLPALYNMTLQHQWVHNGEHTLFFFTGLLFWAHILHPGPLRERLDWVYRAAYAVGAMVVGWLLALTLVLYPYPIYPHYANLPHRPGGITALADQQIAGGMMWILGSISYTLVAFYAFARWATPDSRTTSKRAPLAT